MAQIVSYLTLHQEKVKFPDRTTTLIENHPFMTQLDFFDMQEARETQWGEQQQRHALRKQRGVCVKVLLRLRLLSNIVIEITVQLGGALM